MAHAETCLKPVMKLGGTLLGKLQLDPKLRELCLLHAVKLEGGEYEWVQHVPIARDLGCTQPQIAALADGDDEARCFDAREKAALHFTREVVIDVGASEATVAEAQASLRDREMVELILMAQNSAWWPGAADGVAQRRDRDDGQRARAQHREARRGEEGGGHLTPPQEEHRLAASPHLKSSTFSTCAAVSGIRRTL